MHDDVQIGVHLREMAHPTGVIEVHVSQEHGVEVADGEAHVLQSRFQGTERSCRSRIHKHRRVAGDEVRGDGSRQPCEMQVQRVRLRQPLESIVT